MDASVEHLLEITRGVSQVGVASERKKSTSIIEENFSSLRNVLLAFSSVWLPHIIDINYIVIKIRSNIKHSFYQQQGKKGRSYSQIFDSTCIGLLPCSLASGSPVRQQKGEIFLARAQPLFPATWPFADSRVLAFYRISYAFQDCEQSWNAYLRTLWTHSFATASVD